MDDFSSERSLNLIVFIFLQTYKIGTQQRECESSIKNTNKVMKLSILLLELKKNGISQLLFKKLL